MYVIHGRRPSRRERNKEMPKPWMLKILDDKVICSVCVKIIWLAKGTGNMLSRPDWLSMMLWVTKARPKHFIWPGKDSSGLAWSKTSEITKSRAPSKSIKTIRPLQMIASVDVLVIKDHFTKMAHGFACSNQSAKQVASQPWDRYFCVYGFPERNHSD